MKKIKILSHPTQIATIHLDDYSYTEDEVSDKVTRMQIRRWRKLRHEMV